MRPVAFVAILVLILSPIAFLGYDPLQAGQAQVQVQSLVPFTSTIPRTSSPKVGVLGIDVGTGTFGYSPSKLSWARSTGNFSLGSFLCGGLPMATTGLKNSTTIQLQGSVFSLFVKNTTSPYQKEVIVSGSVVSSTVCVFTFSNPMGKPASDCDTNNLPNSCTSVQFGSEGFDWTGMPCSYNNITLLLSCTFTGSFLFDPTAIDGKNVNTCGPAVTTCNTTLTTTSSPDVIIAVGKNAGGCNEAVSGGGLTWSQRFNDFSLGVRPYEWSAVASSTLSAVTITATFTGCASSSYSIAVFGVSGANTATVFDPNAGFPYIQSGVAGATPRDTGVTSNNPNDMCLLLVGYKSITSFPAVGTCGTGNTMARIESSTSASPASIDDFITTSTLSSATVTLGGTASDSWNAVTDAITANVAQKIQITTLTAGIPSNLFATITISGSCAYSNSTFTANGNLHSYTPQAACTTTLANPITAQHTRYCFNISPKPTCGTSVSFATCSSSPCATYVNSTYYQLNNNMTATPLTPSTWDAVYSGIKETGTFVGSAAFATACPNTVSGGGVVSCVTANKAWYDYNLAVCLPNLIGNTWFAQAPSCFTQTTANNVNNVNYVQSNGDNLPYTWLLVIPLAFIFFLLVRRR